MLKNIFILLLQVAFSLLLTSCSKPEKISNEIGYAELKFTPVGDIRIQNPIKYDGIPHTGNNEYLIPLDLTKDSIEISIKFNENKPELNKKISNKPGRQSYFLYYDNPIDSTATIALKHPLGDVKPPDGKSLLKIINLNKQLSPDGSPIHIARYEFIKPWVQWVDPYVPIHNENPVDTIFNITSSVSDEFNVISPLIEGPMSHFGKILKANKKELLINGNKVYIFFNSVGEACILYIPDQDIVDQTDYNDYNFGLNPDNGYSLNALQFMYR